MQTSSYVRCPSLLNSHPLSDTIISPHLTANFLVKFLDHDPHLFNVYNNIIILAASYSHMPAADMIVHAHMHGWILSIHTLLMCNARGTLSGNSMHARLSASLIIYGSELGIQYTCMEFSHICMMTLSAGNSKDKT